MNSISRLKKAAITAGLLTMFVQNAVAKDGLKVFDSDLRTVLQVASKITGQKLDLSPALKGVVRSQELPANLPQLLTSLQDELQLDWYQDGETVFVSGKNESISRVVDLNKIKIQALEEAMSQASIDINKHEMRLMTDANSIYFTGPPSLVNRVQAMVRNLNQNQMRQKSKSVRLIRGGVVSYIPLANPEEE